MKKPRHLKTKVAGLVTAFGGCLVLFGQLANHSQRCTNVLITTGCKLVTIQDYGLVIFVAGVVGIGLLAAEGRIDN